MKITQLILDFYEDSSGATAIEYGLIAALIAIAIVGALQITGAKLNSEFTNVQNQL